MADETKNKLGISISLLFFLALLGVPRVIAHDLRLVEPGSFLNTLLAILPPVLWIGIVLWKKASKPFMALLIIGVFYGIMLALTHQILWFAAFDSPPTLGGNLSNISPLANAIITRSFAFISRLVTGTVVGAISGVIAAVLNRFRFYRTQR